MTTRGRLTRGGTRVTRLVTGAMIAAGATATLVAGCGLVQEQDGMIKEVETGRNGVKVEVKNGDTTYETYLIPNTECEQDEYIRDCADADDYLVVPDGAVPGLNGRGGSRDDD